MNKKKQHTIRNVTERLNARLREIAAEYGQSLNEASLAALKKGAGISEAKVVHHDLDGLSGTCVRDKKSECPLDTMRVVGASVWKSDGLSTPVASGTSVRATTGHRTSSERRIRSTFDSLYWRSCGRASHADAQQPRTSAIEIASWTAHA